MNIEQAGVMDLTDSEGRLLARTTTTLTAQEAQLLRGAAKLLRAKRFRMTIRCDACFEGGRGDGMRGEITRTHIDLECRCRLLRFQGETL
jgi:hypothetical protein